MTRSNTTKQLLGSISNAAALRKLLANILFGTVLLLPMTFLAGCGTFAEVVAAQPKIAKLTTYMPPRPTPVIPSKPILLKLPQVWATDNPEAELICLPIEQGFDLKAYIKAVAHNQAQWVAYADYWEGLK